MTELMNLYVAYSIIWVGLFLYIIKIHLDQRKLLKEIKLLKETIDGKKGNKNL